MSLWSVIVLSSCKLFLKWPAGNILLNEWVIDEFLLSIITAFAGWLTSGIRGLVLFDLFVPYLPGWFLDFSKWKTGTYLFCCRFAAFPFISFSLLRIFYCYTGNCSSSVEETFLPFRFSIVGWHEFCWQIRFFVFSKELSTCWTIFVWIVLVKKYPGSQQAKSCEHKNKEDNTSFFFFLIALLLSHTLSEGQFELLHFLSQSFSNSFSCIAAFSFLPNNCLSG
jgi:hypothetical protein